MQANEPKPCPSPAVTSSRLEQLLYRVLRDHPEIDIEAEVKETSHVAALFSRSDLATRAKVLAASILGATQAQDVEVRGWIVANGSGTKWRVWRDGMPVWTEDRDEATRYARREDADAVHREDEDAWLIQPYEVAISGHGDLDQVRFEKAFEAYWSPGVGNTVEGLRAAIVAWEGSATSPAQAGAEPVDVKGDTGQTRDLLEAGLLRGDETCECGECTVEECDDCMMPDVAEEQPPDPVETRGNFEAVSERTENDNFHTSIYESDYKGLLIARCNQNGKYPWQARAILAGLNSKKEALDALASPPADRGAEWETKDWRDEWEALSDWHTHDGGESPAELLEELVEVERRGPDPDHWIITEAHKIDWPHTGGREDVLRWRLVQRRTSPSSEDRA